MGHSIPQTLRVLGTIKNTPIIVLIDSGSTRNFIQERVAKNLNLPFQQTEPFQVLVGNGEELVCSSICSNISLTLDLHEFVVDLFVLPISGTEMVLARCTMVAALRPCSHKLFTVNSKVYARGQTH